MRFWASLLALCLVVWAEQGILVVRVSSAAEELLPKVRIGTAGDGSTEFTDNTGRARIKLAPQTRPGGRVTLQVVAPPGLVIVSPWRGEAIVPSFDNDSGNYVDVILVRRGDLHALEDASVLAALVANSVRPPAPPLPKSPAKKLLAFLKAPSSSPFTQSFQVPPQSAPPSTGALVSDNAARELGFSKADVDRAFASWGVDALTWRMVVLTGVIELGTDPFSMISGNIDGNGITFGIGMWNIGRGSLQPLLKDFRQADAKHFDYIMGSDLPFVLNLMEQPPTRGLTMVTESILHSSNQRASVPEPWKSRFISLGRYQPFQRIQMSHMQPWVSGARTQALEAGFRSERAIAFAYDLRIQEGAQLAVWRALPENRAAFERAIGRPPDEQECLLILANLAAERVPTIIRAAVRQRRLVFALGQGSFYGRQVSLEQAGLGMRDYETGAPIKLANDGRTLNRLTDGWIPGSAQ